MRLLTYKRTIKYDAFLCIHNEMDVTTQLLIGSSEWGNNVQKVHAKTHC